MVIAAGTLRRARKSEEYSEEVSKLKQIIKDNNLDLTEKANSLESKTNFWGGLSFLSGALFGTAAFGAPVFGYIMQNFAKYLGYEPGEDIMGFTTLAYFFGSGIGFAICGSQNERYAEKFLEELKKKASEIAINYNL